MELSIYQPTPYVKNNFRDFLPHWQTTPESVIIVLQKAQIDLRENSAEVGQEKDRLRENFLNFAQALTTAMNERDFLTAVIDPKNGMLLGSLKATQIHDDAKVASELLNLPLEYYNGCKLIKHPQWHTATYPSVIMSNATHILLKSIIDKIVAQKG